MRLNTTTPLLNKLTGTETFRLVMNNYLEEKQHKARSFSDNDLQKAIAGLSTRYEEKQVFYHWREAMDVIHTIQYEVRLEAMDAVWKLCIITECIANALQPTFTQEEKRGKLEEQWAESHSQIHYMEGLLAHIAELHLILDVFSEVLSLDLSVITHYEMGLIAQHIEIYNKVAECVNGIIGGDMPLPILDISREVLFPGKKERFTAAIRQGEIGSFWQVLRELGKE